MDVLGRGTAAETFVWEGMGKRAPLDVGNFVRCAGANARINCAAMHMNIVIVSVDNNIVVMAVPVMTIVTLAIRNMHAHVET